jgi:hypothetical protein
MALLGSSVDPRLFVQDYSGFTRAAEIQAQGMQNLGAAIGQGIKDFGEARQERKKLDAQIKADSASIESAMKLGDSLGIDIKSYLAPIQAKINDPNTTPMEAAAYGRAAAQGISNAFTLGIGAQDRRIKLAQLGAESDYRDRMAAASETRAAASVLSAQQGAAPKYEQKKTTVNVDGSPVEVDVLMDQYGNAAEIGTKKPIKDIQKFVTGEEGWEGEAMPTPTSQVGGSASDLIANAAQMNIGKLSTAKTPGTQGGNMGCADAICRTFKQATGEELVPGGTLSTREMANTLANDPRFVKVSLDDAQKGDIVLTPRSGKKAGHTGIVIDGGAIASNSSKGFAGKSPGTFVKNYTIDSWKRNVAPRNPKETAAYRYVGSEAIDNALSMGGDMTQQAMGTPEQQAEIARMIQEGQGFATASTEAGSPVPSQPAQTPRPLARGVYVDQKQGGQKQVKIVTGEEAKALDLEPLGTYEVSYQDGQMTGVQTIKAAPSVGDVIAMEKRQEEQVAKQQMAIATENKSTRMIDLMTELKNSPGFTNLFGANWYPKGLRGTPGADAAALFKQIESLGFMEAIKDMKGMGALSDAEGQKASAAFLGISPDMSEEAAKNKIDEVIRYIKKGQERIQTGNLIETKANKGPSISGANAYFNQFNPPPAR